MAFINNGLNLASQEKPLLNSDVNSLYGKLRFVPVCFDSLGAKSSCIFVETPDVKIVVDPGVAALQKGFPADERLKSKWKEQCKRKIESVLEISDIVVISHYHHDHYIYDEPEIYRNKLILLKNPNEFINLSQRKRAEEFLQSLMKVFAFKINQFKPSKRAYKNPMEALKLASQIDYGEYAQRKKELLEAGLKWFFKLTEKWLTWPWFHEVNSGEIRIIFPECRTFVFGKTVLKFTCPFFHGV